MRRLLLALVLLVVSSHGYAAVIDMGTYTIQADAYAACYSHQVANGGSFCSCSVDGNGQGWCRSTYELNTLYWYVVPVCPDGQSADSETGKCQTLTEANCGEGSGAPDGSGWNSETESCECPEGQTDFFGTDGSYSCVAEIEECTSSSENFTGAWVNDTPICDYSGDCGDNETGGIVNTGNGDQWVCLPNACTEGMYINGNCYTQDDGTSSPQESFGPQDTDGDGTPDYKDSYTDANGNVDPTRTASGALKVEDESRRDGSATAVGGCDQPPTCSGGDPQTCALLKQQWYAMCHTEDYQSSGGFYDPESSDDIGSRIDSAFSDFKDRAQNASAISGIDNFFEFNSGGSCPSYPVSVWVFDFTFDQWCSTDMPWGLISGMILAVSLLVAARIAVA